MSSTGETTWHIAGEEIAHCNCDWGCPCQFEAAPTHGRCEAFCAFEIREGHYGDVPLAGIRFAIIYSWPGRVDEGNGTRQMIVDDRATDEQRVALNELNSGEPDAGTALLERAAQLNPRDVSLHRTLGRVKLEQCDGRNQDEEEQKSPSEVHGDPRDAVGTQDEGQKADGEE